MDNIVIGTKNRHKAKMLAGIVAGRFLPQSADSWPEPPELGSSFKEIAEDKAKYYSLVSGGYAIATDSGAVFPGLKGWNPLETKRFAEGDDAARIAALLDIMNDVTDRTVEWHETLAVARDGMLLFSVEARAMDGVVAKSFDPAKYREGIWLCSLTEFPEFGGRNYFDLAPEEQSQTEDSWTKLATEFQAWADRGMKCEAE